MSEPVSVQLDKEGKLRLPKRLLDELGWVPDSPLEVRVRNNTIVLTRQGETEGSPWLKELYDEFAAVRKSLEGYTEQEINDAIDEAVQEVRRKHGRRRNSA